MQFDLKKTLFLILGVFVCNSPWVYAQNTLDAHAKVFASKYNSISCQEDLNHLADQTLTIINKELSETPIHCRTGCQKIPERNTGWRIEKTSCGNNIDACLNFFQSFAAEGNYAFCNCLLQIKHRNFHWKGDRLQHILDMLQTLQN